MKKEVLIHKMNLLNILLNGISCLLRGISHLPVEALCP
jgi:hypothetical protein